ncbi:MAG: glycosyltransferase family 39 protein [Deltaproteobacteria bacterium]|nr:glycosyltransferase family 39 protein [Deltaproteobacteria bacterium]
MKNYKKRTETAILLTSGAVLVALFVCTITMRWTMTDQTPFIMDELVDMQIGVQFARGVQLYGTQPLERTPLMTILVGLFTDSSEGSFVTAVSGRRLMWVAMILIALGTYLIAYNVLGARIAPMALVLLFSFSSFLDRSFRIRADVISTLMSLPALFLVTASVLTPLRLAFAGLFLGMALLTTQKALYFVIAFAVALIGRHIRRYGFRLFMLKRILVDGLISAGGFLVPVGAIVAWAKLNDCLEEFVQQCFFWALDVGFATDVYASAIKYLWQSLERNPVFWLLAMIGIIALLLESMRRVAPPEKETSNSADTIAPSIALGLWSLTLVLLYWQHKTKFPYIFVNVAPCLAICGALPLGRLWLGALLPPRFPDWKHITLLAGFIFFFVYSPYLHHERNLKEGRIGRQADVMNRVDKITDPEDNVFDGTGVIVCRGKATPYSITSRWVMERRAGAKYNVIDWLRKSEPKVMLKSYRIKRLSSKERRFVDSRFVKDWDIVYAVGSSVSHKGKTPTAKNVELLATTDYAIIANDRKNVRIDGKTPAEIERLSAGYHRIVVEGKAQKVVIKYARAHKTPRPRTINKSRFFPSYAQ